MSNVHTPAAASFGRRIRITYLTVLALLFVARMWGVHGVLEFLGSNGSHGEIVGVAGRLRGQSTEVLHAAFLGAFAPEMTSGDGTDRALENWAAQQARVAQLLPRVCADVDALCRHFHTLEEQMFTVAASARAAAAAGPADRGAALGRLTVLQGKYITAAQAWVEELAANLAEETRAQQHKLLLWAIGQVLATAVIIAFVLEPVIQRLQRERSAVDRSTEGQSRLLTIVERASNAVIISDPKGRIEWVNQGFVRLTGYTLAAAAGRPQDEVICADRTDPSAREALRTAIDSGIGCQVELLSRNREGKPYWVQIDLQPIRSASGALTSFMAFCTDITDQKRDQDERHELLGRLQKIGSQLPGMVFQYRLRPDGKSHFPYASEGIRQIYGVSPESVLEDAGGAFAVLHADDAARVRETIAISAAQLTPWREEYRVCPADGRVRWVLGTASAERESDGSVLWHGFTTDVTERRCAMQAIVNARTLLQGVLDAATEVAIIATDVEGRITVFNSGAERMLQYSSSEMVGRRNPPVIHLDGEVIAPLAERNVSECTYVRKDGSSLTVMLTVTAMRNAGGDISGYLSVAADVTERRQARESLQAAKDAAERANRAKSEFLAAMSHEIRTPMNGVLGFANLLRDTALDKEQIEFVRTIESSGKDLLGIINDILDFSKVEAGAMTLENIPFDLAESIEEVVALMAVRAEEKHLDLRLDIAANAPRRIVADPGRLKQILVNLIGNAIKFTSAGGVHVAVTAGGDENHELKISVRDTGIGISPAARSVLFQKFTQADTSTTRRYGGTGLGLAISRQLIHLMGGRIDVDSTPGAGSTFWFAIPVELAESAEPDSALAETEAQERADAPKPTLNAGAPSPANLTRVLVVEDNSVNQKVAVRLLERLGCRVDIAGNGAEAIEMTSRLPYGLVFMDCHMPEMDGFDATLAIRRRENALGLSALPIVALTASVLQEDRNRCLSAGMDGVIGKPVQSAELAQALRRFARAGTGDVTV